MSNLTCSRSCLMKRDLECSVDKLSFMKENWPSFAQIENVDRLSKAELQCSLDRKSTRLNSSHLNESRMPSSA